jgi:hypothetical protein
MVTPLPDSSVETATRLLGVTGWAPGAHTQTDAAGAGAES